TDRFTGEHRVAQAISDLTDGHHARVHKYAVVRVLDCRGIGTGRRTADAGIAACRGAITRRDTVVVVGKLLHIGIGGAEHHLWTLHDGLLDVGALSNSITVTRRCRPEGILIEVQHAI